jgi:hypothetical protein
MGVMDWLRSSARVSTSPKEVAGTGAAQSVAKESAPQPKPESRQNHARAESVPVPTAGEAALMVVGGLNFMDAIVAHQKWKTRLAAYLVGTSDEKLDYRVICRDDQCVLGKWINGAGSDIFGHIPLFSQLKMTHAQFHLAAASIVSLQDDGKPEKARDALRQGDYPQNSIRVQGLLSSLYLEVKDQG